MPRGMSYHCRWTKDHNELLWTVCRKQQWKRLDRIAKEGFTVKLMVFEDRFPTGIDRVVRIDNQSSWKHIVSVKVRALRMIEAGGDYLITHAVWNIRGKQTPFIATPVLLRRQTERADLLSIPIASPMRFLGRNMSVEIAIGIAVEALAALFLHGRLNVTRMHQTHRTARPLLRFLRCFVFSSRSLVVGWSSLVGYSIFLAHNRVHPSTGYKGAQGIPVEEPVDVDWEVYPRKVRIFICVWKFLTNCLRPCCF